MPLKAFSVIKKRSPMDAHSHEMKNVSDKIKVEVKDKNGNATAILNGPIPSYDKKIINLA